MAKAKAPSIPLIHGPFVYTTSRYSCVESRPWTFVFYKQNFFFEESNTPAANNNHVPRHVNQYVIPSAISRSDPCGHAFYTHELIKLAESVRSPRSFVCTHATLNSFPSARPPPPSSFVSPGMGQCLSFVRTRFKRPAPALVPATEQELTTTAPLVEDTSTTSFRERSEEPSPGNDDGTPPAPAVPSIGMSALFIELTLVTTGSDESKPDPPAEPVTHDAGGGPDDSAPTAVTAVADTGGTTTSGDGGPTAADAGAGADAGGGGDSGGGGD
jgi:hypothetical protein